MSKHDEVEHRVLSAARRALSPTTADQARIRLSTLAALDVASEVGRNAFSASRPLTERLSDGIGDVVDRVAPWASKILAASAIAGASGAAGYYFGFRAGERHVERPAPVLSVPAAVPHALVETPQSEERKEAPGLAPSPTPPGHSANAAPSPKGSGEKEDSLETEIRMLRRVEQARRAHNPRFALALLQELSRTVPQGDLVQERRAAFVMASCEAGLARSPDDLVRSFSKQFPGSVYAHPVEEACAPAAAASSDRGPDPAQ